MFGSAYEEIQLINDLFEYVKKNDKDGTVDTNVIIAMINSSNLNDRQKEEVLELLNDYLSSKDLEKYKYDSIDLIDMICEKAD